MKYDNILDTIGATPVVRLNKSSAPDDVKVWVKLEAFNPAGSVKDRPALNMIIDAEKRGVLNPGDTIVEPTSGNTGIGLAMVAAFKDYRAVFTMAEDMSEERKRILRSFGAEIELTPAHLGTKGAIERARELEEEKGYFFVGQHFNPANPDSCVTSENVPSPTPLYNWSAGGDTCSPGEKKPPETSNTSRIPSLS